jgi:hypothetical protein
MSWDTRTTWVDWMLQFRVSRMRGSINWTRDKGLNQYYSLLLVCNRHPQCFKVENKEDHKCYKIVDSLRLKGLKA